MFVLSSLLSVAPTIFIQRARVYTYPKESISRHLLGVSDLVIDLRSRLVVRPYSIRSVSLTCLASNLQPIRLRVCISFFCSSSCTNCQLLVWCCFISFFLLRYLTLGSNTNNRYRDTSVLLTEQINVQLRILQNTFNKDSNRVR